MAEETEENYRKATARTVFEMQEARLIIVKNCGECPYHHCSGTHYCSHVRGHRYNEEELTGGIRTE